MAVVTATTTTTTTTTVTTTITIAATAGFGSSQQVPSPTPTDAVGTRNKVAVYFTNWGIYEANYQPYDLPADQITHVLYAFADIAPDGEVKSSDSWADIEKRYDNDSWSEPGNNIYGCVKQLNLLKRQNRNLKLLLSIGGWTYSSKFALPASTEAGRKRFASSAVKLMTDWGFDGLDVDWEYPQNAQEAQDYVLLLQACREALDNYAAEHAQNYHFLLTVASPAGSQNYETMDLPAMDALLDAWNLMAYDYAGGWDSTTGHQAALFPSAGNPESTKFNTETAVNAYIDRGIQPSKISLGIPLYGRSFLDTDGLGKPFNGLGTGSIQEGIWLYKDLPRPGASEQFDNATGAAYSYDPGNRELVSYDNIQSAELKAQWILQTGLGGVVFWEASGDQTGSKSLIGVFNNSFSTVEESPNLLSYPSSQYDNIRNNTEG